MSRYDTSANNGDVNLSCCATLGLMPTTTARQSNRSIWILYWILDLTQSCSMHMQMDPISTASDHSSYSSIGIVSEGIHSRCQESWSDGSYSSSANSTLLRKKIVTKRDISSFLP